MTSNEERRKLAESLRGIHYYEDDEIGVETCDGYDILEALGIEACDPFVADGFPRSEVERLADLIDRPTCEMEFDTVHCDYVCSRCGQTYQYFETYDGDGHPVPFRHCPVCGSEVVEK